MILDHTGRIARDPRHLDVAAILYVSLQSRVSVWEVRGEQRREINGGSKPRITTAYGYPDNRESPSVCCTAVIWGLAAVPTVQQAVPTMQRAPSVFRVASSVCPMRVRSRSVLKRLNAKQFRETQAARDEAR